MSNKSGTSPISTPKGGGAQSGLGEKFSPDLFTGTGNFSVPIALPPGRNGFQPELTLQYSTGSSNSVFGLGWGLSVPGVMRKTAKGVPVYDDEKDVFILSGAEDLVPVGIPASGVVRYRPRTEGLFARIDHYKNTANNYWKVMSKDGLTSWYGTEGMAGNDPAVVMDPDNSKKIFAWKLTKTQDLFGNVIEYIYSRDQVRENDFHKWDQVYLSEIRYADYKDQTNNKRFLVRISFEYENRPDPFSEYKCGFEMRTTKRCKSISIYTHPYPLAEILTRTYNFQFTDEVDNAEDLPVNGTSILRRVEVIGHDGNLTENLPPLDFRYTAYKPNKQKFKRVEGSLPPVSLGKGGFELASLFGNGLPDVLEMSGGVVRYWRNLGNGTFDMPRFMKEAPAGLNLGDPDVQLIDADGDGRIDLMVNSEKLSGYFPSRFGGTWDKKSFKKYRTAPSFSFQDPEVKLIDLTGDGVTDAIRSGSSLECFFNDKNEGWKETRRVVRKKLDAFPNVNFSDPRIKWGDMCGDGMQDIVYVFSGNVHYWPSTGYGSFAKKVQMKNAPRFPHGYDPKRILLGDVDGDGLADIVYVDFDKVTIWFNKSGNGFSEPVTITNTPAVPDADSIRLEDLYGNGTSGVLFTLDASLTNTNRWYFLDLTGGIKPYLLHEMDNNMGSLTRVKYDSSILHYLRDQKKKTARWKTTLPFPVQVVSRVEVHDKISKGKLTTEYLYHHGYWDGGEREFRGFGRVDQRDTETFETYNSPGLHNLEGTPPLQGGVPEGGGGFNSVDFEHYSPPTETRNWFHLGPVGDEFGEWEEVYFDDEYWQGDPQVLKRDAASITTLRTLPRRAKRDALRTLRGGSLRTELYALTEQVNGEYVPGDGGIPYTVTESVSGVMNLTPSSPPLQGGVPEGGGGFIFFVYSIGSRTTQWERGNDPMSQLSFSFDYDEYGQARKQLAVAVPRGRRFSLTGADDIAQETSFDVAWDGKPYLSTVSFTTYAQKDTLDKYMVDRVCRSISYDVLNDGSETAFELRDRVINANLPVAEDSPQYKIIACSFNYYDGTAFTGLAYGQLGDYGAAVRSETLIITEAIINAAYDVRPPCFEETPDWSAYPAGFTGSFQNSDPHLGYKDHNIFASEPNYPAGWYAPGSKTKYDFHDNALTAKGLVLETKDAFDNRSTVSYDAFKLLPLEARQYIDVSNYLATTAEYDYRVLQAKMITDPNGNRSVFGFSPLGLMKQSGVIGKEGENEGDIITESPFAYEPSVKMEYDFLAYYNNEQPVWVKTIQREQHWQDMEDSPAIIKVEYTDGFGRLLQTRTQAEDVLFGDSLFGDSGLPEDQTQNADAVGIERAPNALLNVVVSGWQVYNNKGKVVEQYEPFFDKGFDYISPFDDATLQSAMLGGVKVKLYYDPRGQVIRTINPDNSEQRVIMGKPNLISALPTSNYKVENFKPTAWENYTYDANDLAGITHPLDSEGYNNHWYTPSIVVVDSLGRSVKTRELLPAGQTVELNYQYDIKGNILNIRDSLDRIVFEYVYDLLNQSIKTKHLDAGIKNVSYDCAGKAIEMKDEKGSIALNAYDTLSRPTIVFAKDNGNEDFGIRQYMIYGDNPIIGPLNPAVNNFLGQLYKLYDESGLNTILNYDYKTNILTKIKQVIKDSLLIDNINDGVNSNWSISPYRINWTNTPWDEETNLLEGDYRTDLKYDAINRVLEVEYPKDINDVRNKLIPTYNKSGNIEKINFGGTDYVKHIAYNSRGQKLLIAYGNNFMVRYVYDKNTFRATRIRTEKYDYIQSGNEHQYNYLTGNVRQDISYVYDLKGNILKTKDRTPDCGIQNSSLGTDALDRLFEYDSLYRLIKATGRESSSQPPSNFWDEATIPGTPNANNCRSYNRKYEYNTNGNILFVRHFANSNNFVRKYNYLEGCNQLEDVDNGQDPRTVLSSFVYDSNGNLITSNTERNYEWDFADRVRAYYNQTGTGVEPSVYAQYVYESSGARVKKIVRTQGGNWESIVYLDGVFEYHKRVGSVTEEKNYSQIEGGIELRTGSYADDISENIIYNLSDHLNSVSIRLNDTGNIIDREEYYPFGDSSLRTFDKKRYRFTGKEKDTESGLYYFGARYFAPWLCQFISVDPAAIKSVSISPFAYGNNNPVNFNDPSGRQAEGGGDQSGAEGSDNISQTEFAEKTTLVDPSGKKLNQVQTTGTVIGETFSQTQITTTAEVSDAGTITVHQIKQEVAGRGEDVYAYKTSIGKFEGSLSQAKVEFPDVDFSGLDAPAGSAIQLNKEAGVPAPGASWQVRDEFDAETQGGPISWDEYMDRTQLVLDGIGLIPGFGEVADIANGIISLSRGNYMDAALSFASAIPGFGYIAAASKAGLKTTKGVYEITTNGGKYIGQSSNVFKRIQSHFSKGGKLRGYTALSQEKFLMGGSTKYEREIYEQYRILKNGGTGNLINKVNPVGGRFDLKSPKGLNEFYKEAEQIINKFNLPSL